MTRNDIAYVGSSVLSALGNSLAAVVLPLLVLTTTGSVISAGAVALATGLPQFAAAAIGGVALDRINRRTVAIAGDAISALAIAALPIINATVGLSVGWFVAFGVFAAIGDVPALTARESIVPALARLTGTAPEKLVSSREGLMAVAVIVGPVAGGGLIVAAPAAALWITALTSALAGTAMLAIPAQAGLTARADGGPRTRLLGDFLGGVRYLAVENPTLRAVSVVGLAVTCAVAAIQGIVLPAFFSMAGHPGRTGVTLTVLAVGMLLGAGVYGAIHQQAKPRALIVTGSSIAVAGLWLMTGLFGYASILVAVGLVGIGGGVLSGVFGVMSLRLAHGDMQGRVLGNQNALALGLIPFITLGAALIIDGIGVRAALVAIAGLLSATLAWGSLSRSTTDHSVAAQQAAVAAQEASGAHLTTDQPSTTRQTAHQTATAGAHR
jgi:MFS family permease